MNDLEQFYYSELEPLFPFDTNDNDFDRTVFAIYIVSERCKPLNLNRWPSFGPQPQRFFVVCVVLKLNQMLPTCA
jgi:hypothetical protein